MNKKQKLKNLKDLDYNHVLNKQNIALVLIGTAFIYVIFTDKPPLGIPRASLIISLMLMGIAFLWYFGKQLFKIREEIKRI